jgi:hypothetical protein
MKKYTFIVTSHSGRVFTLSAESIEVLLTMWQMKYIERYGYIKSAFTSDASMFWCDGIIEPLAIL